ncbi:hypothetical protein SH528x_002157 [Novipirellula sp. SH528]|uniref:hypothetical protein n=1 Tax=Novipirellula sp. SH528 TaxID=3454466 RepID=UPI003FA16FB3
MLTAPWRPNANAVIGRRAIVIDMGSQIALSFNKSASTLEDLIQNRGLTKTKGFFVFPAFWIGPPTGLTATTIGVAETLAAGMDPDTLDPLQDPLLWLISAP